MPDNDREAALARKEIWPSLPLEAFCSSDLGEFILRYDDMRSSKSPEDTLLAFAQSTYAAAARLANWDRPELERARA